MALLRKEDLLAIENVLYEPKKEELVARQFLSINSNHPRYAPVIGYVWYTPTGSAKILAAGASAKDVPFVGEEGGMETLKVYKIVTGIRYEKAEIEAVQASATLGKGPSISLDTTRVSTARRFVAETENKIAFVGDKDYNIKGILNHSGIQYESVALGGKGSTATEKKLWKNKTPQEILEDLRAAKAAVEKNDIFKARVLLLDSDHYNMLLKPYSDMATITVLQWIQSQGEFFEKIIKTSNVSKKHNCLESSQDCFVVLDNDPEIIELAVLLDMEIGNPVYDILGTSEQIVEERTAGCIIRHPSAIYVGGGI
ncbi:MAG: DUF2184 domain-containing protein [Leptospirales bacterium]|nr:DUF2184 domain-containing protein [Leptospirales bacterium]